MSKNGIGKKKYGVREVDGPVVRLNGPIVLAANQHHGKASDKLLSAAGEGAEVAAILRNPKAGFGPAVRRGFRRNLRSLTSLDHRVEVMTKKPRRSSGKHTKLLNKHIQKYMRQTRLLVGLLIRATGAAAPSLIAEQTYIMPAHQRRIAELGTTISKPNLIARDEDVI